MSTSEKTPSVEGLLSEDHEALDRLLIELVAALDRADGPDAFAHLDLFWARLAMHIRGENLHLFPAILAALQSGICDKGEISSLTAREAIGQLRTDHNFFMEELAGAVKLMRNAGTGPEDVVGRLETVRLMIAILRQRLEAHNKLEEEVVYRWPANLLKPDTQAALEAKIRNELNNLPPRFHDDRRQ